MHGDSIRSNKQTTITVKSTTTLVSKPKLRKSITAFCSLSYSVQLRHEISQCEFLQMNGKHTKGDGMFAHFLLNKIAVAYNYSTFGKFIYILQIERVGLQRNGNEV